MIAQPCPLSGKPDIEPTSPNDLISPIADLGCAVPPAIRL
jgi:hypothetical protein